MERWYSIVEYARKFNISDMTVRRRIKTGRLQAVLKEGKYYIPISASQEDNQPASCNQPTSQSQSCIRPSITTTPQKNQISDQRTFQSTDTRKSQENSKLNLAYPSCQPIQAPSVLKSNLNTASYSPSNKPTYSVDKQKFDAAIPTANYNNLVQQFNKFEKILEESYESKVQRLESEIKLQKLENANLKQQVEDLQVLIKLIEKKK